MTNDGQNTLVYDAENRTLSATNGSASGTYTYDGNNLRVKKVSGSTTTVYLFSGSKVIAEYVNGALPSAPTREYIYSSGALLAKIESGATNYYHQDLLSNRLVTDSSGNTVAQMGHFPFGESWYNATGDKLLFTSYERDAESGNDYALARYNISRLGRFSSPDPLPGSIADSQSLNRYLYTENNPINATDPSGAVTTMCNSARDEACPYRDSGGFVFGSTWDEFDILQLALTPTQTPNPDWFAGNCMLWESDCGSMSPWIDTFGNVGLLGLFGGGPPPLDIQCPLCGPLPQPKSPFSSFLERMSQDCIDALNQVGLLGIIDALANSLKIFDINTIAGQLARNYAGPQAGTQTVGSFFSNLPNDAARTIVNVPQPGIYVRGGAGRFDGGDNMYWLLHETAHLAYPKGPQLDISLAGRLSIPYTGGASGGSQALSNYFNNHCDPSLRTSNP
jgi:RHS repeat-associated protein